MKNSQVLSCKNEKMFQSERIEAIAAILKQNGYVTVKYLTEILHYSNATINRDLNMMEKQGLVKRSYGGVEIIDNKHVPLPLRYEKMKAAKRKIAQKAAEYVQNGDTIFIGASTAVEYMGQFLIDKKDITVISNNMALVIFLSEQGIRATCLGGSVVEKPYMLCGPETVENARHYRVDKMFFSTGAISMDGKCAAGGPFYLLYRTMMENAKEIFFLVDHEKVQDVGQRVHSFHDMDYIISDFPVEDAVKEKFEQIKFIEV